MKTKMWIKPDQLCSTNSAKITCNSSQWESLLLQVSWKIDWSREQRKHRDSISCMFILVNWTCFHLLWNIIQSMPFACKKCDCKGALTLVPVARYVWKHGWTEPVLLQVQPDMSMFTSCSCICVALCHHEELFSFREACLRMDTVEKNANNTYLYIQICRN